MSWKRTRPIFLARVKQGWRTGVATLLGTATILGLTFTLIESESPNTVALLVLVVLASVASAWFRGQSTLVPTILVEELAEEEAYVAQYCTPEHLKEACEMTKPYYGDEYVEGSLVENWRMRNSTGFVEILNRSGELCACFGILGLTEDFRKQFYAGNATDTRLRASDVLESDQTRRCRALYISGVVVRDPMTFRSGKRTRVMLWALLQYYKEHFGFRIDRALYGLAANNESDKLFKTFNFNLCCPGTGRRDKCNLYEVVINRQVWKEMMDRVWDLSAVCEVRWKA